MFCKNCGTEIPYDSKFCFKCGTEVALSRTHNHDAEEDEMAFRSDIEKLRGLIIDRNSNEIKGLLNNVISSKENGQVLIENYKELYQRELVEDLKKLSNNYERIKSHLQKFIEFEILDKQYPHNRIDKIISNAAATTELNNAKNRPFIFPWKIVFGVIITIFVFKTCLDSPNENTFEEINGTKAPYSKIGDELNVKHFVYRVNNIRFAKSIGNEFTRKMADGIYLIIDLSLINQDNVEHTLDNNMFKLTDESGIQFESSIDATLALEMEGIETLFLKQCNPKIQKHGSLIFEVPKEGVYYLHLSGGFWTGQTAAVKLTDK